MTPDEIAGHILSMGKAIVRIEAHFEKVAVQVVNNDRTMAEHAVRAENMAREMRDLGHEIRNCQNAHKQAGDVLALKVEKLERMASKTEGFVVFLKWFATLFSAAIISALTWFYNRADTNFNTNRDQAHELVDLRKEILRLDRVIGIK